MPWEMYTLLADADVETAAHQHLRDFLGQRTDAAVERTGCLTTSS
jgi:hypothetical protein